MQIHLQHSSLLVKYNLINQIITPRPIAWISSVNENGVINIAPYDFFAPLSSDPVVFAVSFFPKSSGELKDTLKNIQATKRASICVCDSATMKMMHKSALELDSRESEAAHFDMDMEIVVQDYPPIPKGAKAAFMCDYSDEFSVGKSARILLLEAKECFIQDSIYNENLELDLKNIARVGRKYQISSQFIDQSELD